MATELIPSAETAPNQALLADRVKIYRAVTDGRLEIDESKMWVGPMTICSFAEDRSAERIDPAGLSLKDYANQPIVYLAHSHKFNPTFPPVGSSVDRDGNFSCFLAEDEAGQKVLKASWLCSQATAIAAQVFALVAEGTLRGRSIGVIPRKMQQYRPQNSPVIYAGGSIRPLRTASVILTAGDVFEWSWTGTPQNPDVVIRLKSIMSNGRLDGMPLDDTLEQWIKASFDLTEPVQGIGWSQATITKGASPLSQGVGHMIPTGLSGPVVSVTFAKGTTPEQAEQFMSESQGLRKTALTLDPTSLCLKSLQLDWSGPTEVQVIDNVQYTVAKAMPAGKTKSDPIVPDAELAPADLVEAPPAAAIKAGKPGQRWLKAMCQNLKGLMEQADAALSDVEQPEVLDNATKACSLLKDVTAVLTEAMGKLYPDSEEPEAEVTESAETEEVAEGLKQSKVGLLKSMFYHDRVFVPGQIAGAVRSALGGNKEASAFLLKAMGAEGAPLPEVETSDAAAQRLAQFKLDRALAKRELAKKS